MLIKILSNFLLLILLDRKKRENKDAFGKKVSFEAAFLILLLHNSSEDVLLLLPLYSLIVSFSFYLPAAKLGINIFDKDNTEKVRGDDLGSIGAEVDGGTRPDILYKGLDTDARADNLGIVADNLDIAEGDLDIETNVDA